MQLGDANSPAKEAVRRLVALVEYTKELSELQRRDTEPRLALRDPAASAGKNTGDDSSGVLLHEGHLEKLKEAKRTVTSRDPVTGKQLRAQRPVVAMVVDDDTPTGGAGLAGRAPAVDEPGAYGDDPYGGGAGRGGGGGGGGSWVSIHRPDGDDRSPAAAAACSAYASLFSAHQEALREGRGAQLTVGVGIVRWKLDASTVIDHPLVLMPAELRLSASGAYTIRMADAAQPSLFSFPGVPRAAAALKLLDECARAYQLLGAAPPPPTAKRAWEPLLQRAAQTLSPDGVYYDAPPRVTAKGALHGAPDEVARVYNGFVIWTRCEAAERGLCDDADAMADALRNMKPTELPAALGRLVGIYGLPPAPMVGAPPAPRWPVLAAIKRAIVQPLVGGSDAAGGAGWSSSDGAGPSGGPAETPFLYFGLPSNSQQESVVATLEERGCAVLVGPPGTGKSQTIANVICHYLACGRRVLVTSKGEPALEVLRQKLPPGVRELAVSLGAADASSFRRLEAAVENLADNVAAAQPAALAAATERLRRQVASLTAELEGMRKDEEAWAAPHFPPSSRFRSGGGASAAAADDAAAGGSAGATAAGSGGGSSASRGPLRGLGLHPEVLSELSLSSPETATTSQLADAAAAALCIDPRHAALDAPASRAFFLRGVSLDASRPPPTRALLEQIHAARAACGEALHWGDAALSRGSVAAEGASEERVHELATKLKRRAHIQMAERRGELPRVASLPEAKTLRVRLVELRAATAELEARIAAVLDAGAAAAAAATKAAVANAGGGTSPASPRAGGGGSSGAPRAISPGNALGLSALAAGMRSAYGPPDDGHWLFSMLRHADNAAARRTLDNVRELAERVADLAAQVEASEGVHVPAVLLRMLDRRVVDGGGPATGYGASAASAGYAAGSSLLDDSEVALEVRWHAHPDKRSMCYRDVLTLYHPRNSPLPRCAGTRTPTSAPCCSASAARPTVAPRRR